MSRACLSQVPHPGRSPRPCLVRFDFNEEPSTYYLYPKTSDVGDEIEVAEEHRSTHSPLAKLCLSTTLYDLPDLLIVRLDIARWAVVLENFSQIQIRAQGWGPDGDSGINLTSSSFSKGSIIYLRPDDVFQIGHVTLQLQREALETQEDSKVQVTSSGCDGTTADQQHVHQDGGIKETGKSTPNRRYSISTLHSSHDIDTTVMETPAASRYYIPGLIGSPIMPATAEDDIKNRGDYQMTEPHSNSPNIQASLREGIEGTKEVEVEELISDRNSEENGHLFDEALGDICISKSPVEELTSEPQREVFPGADDRDTEKSTRDLSDRLLDLANLGQDVISSPRSHDPELSSSDDGDIEENSKRSGNPIIVSPQLPPAMTSKQSSRKRKRAADESQDSMRSMINVVIPPSSAGAKYTEQQSLGGESTKKGVVKKPPSSSRSTRLMIHEDSTMVRSTVPKLRVFFASSTTVDKTSKFMGFLENHGVTKVKSVKDCDILCIGNSDLKKTCNLVLAVISGKQVITEEWVLQSVTKGELLDHHGFLARDPVKEAEWETNLSEAIERGKQGVRPFLDFTVHFTAAAKKELGKGFTDLKEIATYAGAKSVQATLPRKSSLAQALKTIVIAIPDDVDLSVLEEGGWRSFNKDIVTLSVLRGSLDMNSDEFLVRYKGGTRSGASKRRKR